MRAKNGDVRTVRSAEPFPSPPQDGTLVACMDVTVETGATKELRDIHLHAEELKGHKGERVVLLLEVKAKRDRADAVLAECTTVLRHAVAEADGAAAERLDGALKELNGLLKGMTVSGGLSDVHMIIGILDAEGMFHVSHAGRAEAYLVRKGVASQITEFAGKPAPLFVHIASGKLEQGDSVVCSSQRLLRSITPAQLASAAQNPDTAVATIRRSLETEDEHAALAVLHVAGVGGGGMRQRETSGRPSVRTSSRRRRPETIMEKMLASAGALRGVLEKLPGKEVMGRIGASVGDTVKKKTGRGGSSGAGSVIASVRSFFGGILADLQHPQRKKRAHLLLLALALAMVIIVWAGVHMVTASQRNKTRAELEALVGQIEAQVQTAENRRIIGDIDAANGILQRAEQQAKQVMDNESDLFRVEAMELLDRIRRKREDINNIERASPRLLADLSVQHPAIVTQGMVGVGGGEFVVYDRQDLYRVLLNSVESPVRVSEEMLILDGEDFPRFQTQVYMMTGNGFVEWSGGQPQSVKTDDPAGWMTGTSMATYLRFLYVLAPDQNQIFKYERLNNRYGAPAEYNVNGELAGGIDMAIDGNIYVLKQGGEIVKLLRGEAQPFAIRGAPADVLKGATRIFKRDGTSFYLLDPAGGRVIVLRQGEGDDILYVRQYLLEGEMMQNIKDLYVDQDETQLFLLDDKHVYVMDLARD